jgi:cytochrome c556
MDNQAKGLLFDAIVWMVSVVAMPILAAQPAWADSVAVDHPKWKAECGSCHTAYPPQFLPASGWRRIMSGLDQHFETDASVDTASAVEIGAFLEQYAGTGKRVRGAQTLRITESAWFRRKHDDVPAATWTLPAVKTPANCAACHTTADRGDFRERNLRLPR